MHPYVTLTHHRFATASDFAAAVATAVSQRTYAGTAVDFLDGTVFGPRRAVPDRRHVVAARTCSVGLHGQPDLLPVDPGQGRRPPHRARLPLALGHRLVLVLAGDVRAEAVGTPVGAQAFLALRRVLEGHRLRAAAPVEGAARPASRARRRRSSSSRTSRSPSTACRSSSTSSTARWVSARYGSAR